MASFSKGYPHSGCLKPKLALTKIEVYLQKQMDIFIFSQSSSVTVSYCMYVCAALAERVGDSCNGFRRSNSRL